MADNHQEMTFQKYGELGNIARRLLWDYTKFECGIIVNILHRWGVDEKDASIFNKYINEFEITKNTFLRYLRAGAVRRELILSDLLCENEDL